MTPRYMCLLAGVLPVVAVAAPGPTPPLFDWIGKNILDRVTISGKQTLRLHFHEVEGDRDAFNQQWYRGRGGKTFTEDRYVVVSGRNVLGVLNFDVQLNNSPFAQPLDRRVSLNYNKNGIKADLGDINATLGSTNELIRFSRLSQGAQIQTKVGDLTIKGVYTKAKSAARTVSLTGNNSPGPYYLQSGLIVDGSLRVQVDGVDQRIGEDYTVNVYAGTITFNRVIPPTSTIVATYETLGPNQGRGEVVGGTVAYDIGKSFTVGVTHIEQRPRNSGTLGQTTEEFQGYGAPSTPYFLLFPPMRERPITVTVDGVLQIEGVDYFFDQNNPQVFYFTRYMPPTSTIRVTYTPMPDPGTFGNGRRQVQGLDFNWKIGKGQTLSFSAARSTLFTPTGKQTGFAQAAKYKLDVGRLSFEAKWRNIPPQYVTVESTGFGRNDRGFETKLTYDAGAGWNLGLQAAFLDIGTPVYQNGSLGVVKGKTRDIRATATYDAAENRKLYLSAASTTGEYAGRRNESHGIAAGYKHAEGRWSFDAGIGAVQVVSPQFSQGGETQMIRSDVYGGRFSGSYKASDDLSFSTAIGLNAIRSGGKDSLGKDLSFKAEYRPNDKLGMELLLADTNSGLITGINGYSGAWGFGYNGNGFSGGGPGYNYNLNAGASRTQVAQFRTTWAPSENFSLDANLLYSKAVGDNLSNNSLTVASLLASWAPSRSTRLTARIEQDNVKFANQPGSSSTTIFGLSLDQEFGRRWRFSGDYSLVASGGTGQLGFARDSTSLFANLTYLIDKRQRAFAEFRTGSVTGYLPDREMYAGIGYSYDILPGVALRGMYRIRERENLSSQNGANSYRSRGFDLELEIRFGK